MAERMGKGSVGTPEMSTGIRPRSVLEAMVKSVGVI